MVVETPVMEQVPIVMGEDGVIRVTGTRVQLEIIIGAFNDGATAETIAQSYSTAKLPDVYQVIAYYLRHKAEVDAYVCERLRKAEEIRREVEARFPQTGMKERLLARRREMQGK